VTVNEAPNLGGSWHYHDPPCYQLAINL